jgi:transposase InsO family protein
MSFDKCDKVVLERYQLITSLLDVRLTDSDRSKLVQEIAQETNISPRTISRYYATFRDNGIEGLRPANIGRPGARVITEEILTEAATLRRESPHLSVSWIIRILEMEGKIEPGSVKRSSLQERLAKIGFSSRQIRQFSSNISSNGRRFQHINSNSLWQADTKHGIHINKKKTYLISFIDDASRYITNSKWYYDEKTPSVMDSFKTAILKHGAPKVVYMDNGSPYKSKSLERACGLLCIKKMHHKPYKSQSKGKIEKFHQFVDKFIKELHLEKVDSLGKLNNIWKSMLEIHYQTREHSALSPATTPKEAFKQKMVGQPNFKSQEELDKAFIMVERGRRVDKSGCVNFRGCKFTGDSLSNHIGRKVDIVWDPIDLSQVWVEIGDLIRIPIKKLVIRKFLPKDPSQPKIPATPIKGESRFIKALMKESKKRQEACFEAEFGSDRPDQEVDTTQETKLNNNQEAVENTDSVGGSANYQRPAISFRSISNDSDDTSTTDESRKGKRQAISFNTLRKNEGDI